MCVYLELYHLKYYQESDIHSNPTDKPPPNVYVLGGSAMFHKYMYILYLLLKSKDKSHGGRGLVMLQKQQDKRSALLECDRMERGGMHRSGERWRKGGCLLMLIS